MKKDIITPLLLAWLISWLAGCVSYSETSDGNEPATQSRLIAYVESNMAADTFDNPETWQDAYVDFLRNFSSHSDNLNNNVDSEFTLFDLVFDYELGYYSNMEAWLEAYTMFIRNSVYINHFYSYFYLRDLDNNGVPELVILQSSSGVRGIITVYAYSGDAVYKVGDHANPKIGVAGERISNNPRFPGLFVTWWGGGIEHYGYLAVEEKNWYLSFYGMTTIQNFLLT